jgi:uncharacterized glyoxalase superfamily protein PhnB
VPGEGDTVVHAQLSFGNGMIMLGSVLDTEFGRLMKQPNEIGVAETQSAYIIVSDTDALYTRAKGAGAKTLLEVPIEELAGATLLLFGRNSQNWPTNPRLAGDVIEKEIGLLISVSC